MKEKIIKRLKDSVHRHRLAVILAQQSKVILDEFKGKNVLAHREKIEKRFKDEFPALGIVVTVDYSYVKVKAYGQGVPKGRPAEQIIGYKFRPICEGSCIVADAYLIQRLGELEELYAKADETAESILKAYTEVVKSRSELNQATRNLSRAELPAEIYQVL